MPCESTAGSNESRGASQRTISPASLGCQRSSGDCSYVPWKIKTKMLSDGLRASLSVLISWTFSRALVQYFCADFLDDLFSNSVGKAFGKVSGFVWDMLRPNNIHVPGKPAIFLWGGGADLFSNPFWARRSAESPFLTSNWISSICQITQLDTSVEMFSICAQPRASLVSLFGNWG